MENKNGNPYEPLEVHFGNATLYVPQDSRMGFIMLRGLRLCDYDTLKLAILDRYRYTVAKKWKFQYVVEDEDVENELEKDIPQRGNEEILEIIYEDGKGELLEADWVKPSSVDDFGKAYPLKFGGVIENPEDRDTWEERRPKFERDEKGRWINPYEPLEVHFGKQTLYVPQDSRIGFITYCEYGEQVALKETIIRMYRKIVAGKITADKKRRKHAATDEISLEEIALQLEKDIAQKGSDAVMQALYMEGYYHLVSDYAGCLISSPLDFYEEAYPQRYMMAVE